jgi:hypothetical protein
VTDAREDAKGLFITAKINLAIQAGRDLYASLKARTLDRFSMGYKAIQQEYVRDKTTGKSIRNLLEVAIMEASVVLFPMAPESVVTSIKSREDYTNMLLRSKDFTSNYQSAQLDDWQYDDWSGISSALQQSILDLFTPGRSPLADFERDVAPQLLDALRQYIQDGIDLGYSTAPASAQGVTPSSMMSMSGAGGQSKAGYLSAGSHAKIAEASVNINKHVKIIQSELSAIEAARHRSRANALAGWDVYGSASASPTYLTKEEEADIVNQLKLINSSLELDNVMREARQDLKDQDPLAFQRRRVEEALQRVVEAESKRS